MSQVNNIFRVVSEQNFTSILSNHSTKLCVLMLSATTCPPCQKYKGRFIQLSKQYPDCIFIYIDFNNYDPGENKYFQKFPYTPTFVYYFNNTYLAHVEGAKDDTIVNMLTVLLNKINEQKQLKAKELHDNKIQQAQNVQINNTDTYTLERLREIHNESILQKKIDGLNKLSQLNKSGVVLTKHFSIESSYDDILLELRLHTDPIFKQQIAAMFKQTDATIPIGDKEKDNLSSSVEGIKHDATSSDDIKKLSQVNQLKELTAVSKAIQQESFLKVKQLYDLRNKKEQSEKYDNKQ